ncbi:unnamed protein product [Clonostachys rosea]|uniref:Beta/gamma crystallin 'Greek key' domain-containing protein n=1 Tax=Bionectria ochroleuca TaxID=29856 RepID=A0ABY6UJV3_BIOOC|nr:unnamed protein product [Clonostachys rosea]
MRSFAFILLATGALAGPAPAFPIGVVYSENNYQGDTQNVLVDNCTKLNENLRGKVNSVLLSEGAFCLTYTDEECAAEAAVGEYQESVDSTEPLAVVAVSCHN